MMLNSEICVQQGTVESSNEGTNLDGTSRNGNGNLLPSICDVRLSGGAIDQVSCSRRVEEEDILVEQMVIVVDPERNKSSDVNDGGAEFKGPSNVIIDKLKTKILQGEKPSHLIDKKCGGGIEGSKMDLSGGEKVCRICHLSSEGSLEDGTSSPIAAALTTDLIQLGCGCKDELGIAHIHCAEAWFKLRGNRICEICEETAKNVSGVVDSRSTQEWNERFMVGIGSRSSERGRGCWRGQPFCNFLMTCLVIAFVLPWFFRVNWL